MNNLNSPAQAAVAPVTTTGASADAIASSSTEARDVSESLHILVVEDHVDTLRVLRRLLESVGHLVATAETAAAAMSYVRANDFDVLLSDIGLPDTNGWDLVRQIKNIRNVPAIAISALDSIGDIRKSRDAGFYGHLTKPLDFQLLQATIQLAVQKNARRTKRGHFAGLNRQ